MSYNNQGQQNPPRQLTILNDFRMRLSGRPLDPSAPKPPSWSIRIDRNRPAIEVYSNLPSEEQTKDKGRIVAGLDPIAFESLLDMITATADGANGTHVDLQVYDFPFVGQNQRSKELKLQVTVRVGKDNEGVVYLSLIHWNSSRPVCVFPVRPSQYFRYVEANGERISEARASQLYARSYANLLRHLVLPVLRTGYTPPPPRDGNQQRGGQGGGGGGYQGNNQGGGNNYNAGGGGGYNSNSAGSSGAAPAAGGNADWESSMPF